MDCGKSLKHRELCSPRAHLQGLQVTSRYSLGNGCSCSHLSTLRSPFTKSLPFCPPELLFLLQDPQILESMTRLRLVGDFPLGHPWNARILVSVLFFFMTWSMSSFPFPAAEVPASSSCQSTRWTHDSDRFFAGIKTGKHSLFRNSQARYGDTVP